MRTAPIDTNASDVNSAVLPAPHSETAPSVTNAANINGERSSLGGVKRRRVDTANEIVPFTENPTGTANRAPAQPAPDDSEYTVSLTDEATEIRTFRNHPQLEKVEKRTDQNSATGRVYLKDGRVVTVPGHKLNSLATTRATEILAAAGISEYASPGRQSRPAKNTP